MSQTTVRISAATHLLLKELSRARAKPMQAILEAAVEEYRRRYFLESVNNSYAALRGDERAWAAIEAERNELERTLADGLPDDRWTEDGRAAPRKKAKRR